MHEDLKQWSSDAAAQLEVVLPSPPEGAEAGLSSIGGIIEKTVALIAALKAGEWMAALKLTRDLINLIVGEDGDVVLEFQQAGLGFRSKLLEVLTGLLLKLVLKELGA